MEKNDYIFADTCGEYQIGNKIFSSLEEFMDAYNLRLGEVESSDIILCNTASENILIGDLPDGRSMVVRLRYRDPDKIDKIYHATGGEWTSLEKYSICSRENAKAFEKLLNDLNIDV